MASWLASITIHDHQSGQVCSFGLVVVNGIIGYAAPVARRHVGKYGRNVIRSYLAKGATVYLMPDPLSKV